ncbi:MULTISPECIES: cyanate transporter [Pantoea]|uniref:Major facilitator transporter n=2 Tax=Pantoea TaxID=53335 RepID=A0A0U3TKW6_9GAMM|nr:MULTISPECIES: cyanate transporter [Pantoea]ALV93261.1 major facilitator transporter [Pantoea vagans]KHJ67037.1 major facilitator transporter [Pantoea rodasii]
MNRHYYGLTLGALVLAGLNMRPFLTSLSPLLGQLRQVMELSSLAASLLPAIPMMMMGAVALAGASLMQRFPLQRLLIAGLALLFVALMARSSIQTGRELVISALFAGLGVGVVQMVMPGLIRQRFAKHSAAITGLWAGALMGGGGLGAALSPWLSAHFGWESALSGWAFPAILAMALWLTVHVPAAQNVEKITLPALWRKPRAWSLALSFGLVNGGYATCVAWLPDAYHHLGWSAQAGGSLLGAMILCQVAGALLMPLLARKADRRPQLIISLVCQLVGMCGFLFAPLLAPWLWAAIAGFGLGAAFPLAMVLALDHLPHPQAGARLVAFMQGAGFIIAGCMPFIAGQLQALTGSFNSVWMMQGAVTLGLIVLNLRFHPHSYGRAFGQTVC